MTRDAFNPFPPHDRGLFGDNEQADTRAKSQRDDLIELPLFFHGYSKSGLALFLSPNGVRSHTQSVPKSLVEEPVTTELVHPPGGKPCQFGFYKIARFKAEAYGWDAMADGKTMRLL